MTAQHDAIMRYVEQHGAIRTADVRILLHVTRSRAHQVLTQLVSDHQLVRNGGGSRSLYLPPNTSRPTTPPPAILNHFSFDCPDCGQPIHGLPIQGRCTPCHLAHGIVEHATAAGIDTTVVRDPGHPARVQAEGADGRPAWLDTLTDVQYLCADRAYRHADADVTPIHGNHRTLTTPARWARNHDACTSGTCETPDAPHYARGLCRPCYLLAWRYNPEALEAA